MQLSILIVNWNTTGLLSALLDSIRTHSPNYEYEVIVVDNASNDFNQQEFRSKYPEVKIIVNDNNAGYAKGNNQALEAASGDYLLLMNPDTEVTPGAIETLVEFMKQHPEAGAAGSKLVRPDGVLDHSLRSFPHPDAIAYEFLGLSRLFPKSRVFGKYRMTYFNYDKIEEVDQPMGSCLILNKKAVNDVGLLDESFPIFFNEVDWLYRIKLKGYKVYFVPEAVVIHHGAGSTKQVKRRKMIDESHDSLIRYYKKHYKGKVFAPVYYFVVACIHFGRFLRG